MKNFKLTHTVNETQTEYLADFMSFPGGERHVRLPDLTEQHGEGMWVFNAPARTPSDVLDLMLVVDALRRMVGPRPKLVLLLPYVPYARQDRVAVTGEPLSAKVFCDLINSLGFDEVLICDPHSDVTPALLNNVTVIDGSKLAQELLAPWITRLGPKEGNVALVAPDAGARKRVETLGAAMGLPVVYAQKKRDVVTGALSSFEVVSKVPENATLVVIDDICDGGGTFVGLAEALKRHTDLPLALYVTHGLFTKGLEPLKAAGYNYIFSGNCLNDEVAPHLTAFLTPTW